MVADLLPANLRPHDDPAATVPVRSFQRKPNSSWMTASTHGASGDRAFESGDAGRPSRNWQDCIAQRTIDEIRNRLRLTVLLTKSPPSGRHRRKIGRRVSFLVAKQLSMVSSIPPRLGLPA